MLDDSPAEIQRKLKKAVTATGSDKKSPGVENLLLLLSHFGSKEQMRYFQDEMNTGTIKYSELKQVLSEEVSNHFSEFREKKKDLLKNPAQLAEVLAEGARKAKAVAHETLHEVKEKTGLL
jgi:tryptophanyl-tRNA synthetase